ncbi:acetyl-CoA carboxylase subunit beta [Neisseria meningitidis]|nr:acetyl-CoA carboxylase subunit beta [Neisseria meningitidis]
MSWLDKILPPKIKNRSKDGSSNVPEGLWHKCPSCSATVYSTELQQNNQVCPNCKPPQSVVGTTTPESAFG